MDSKIFFSLENLFPSKSVCWKILQKKENAEYTAYC